ncbi:glucokinase [Flavobacterium sp. 270]|uniref:ROK family protein n=1 Tax=Flavobacterium sp. 270 TaxID=2512114 RepID=UPI001066D9A8|nr:ROK family protein [Flavobacterium sp. 270]TDW48139.1 glucokinase [Flavobacterium sp. 270]
MALTIGVDVGGSHVSSAAVNNESFKIVKGTYFSGLVDNKSPKEIIFSKWAEVINKTIEKCDYNENIEIAFSMPGPFEYETGRAMFEGNDKFEALYNVSIPEEFSKYITSQNVKFRFLNDASSFGIGSILMNGLDKYEQKVVAITLGTGFGASFLDNVLPLTSGENIPDNGCLWDKIFENGIADEYFSTRWFIKKYEEYSKIQITDGVKEIANKNDEFSKKVFEDFASNFSDFLFPFLDVFETNTLVIGGNIAKCSDQFLPKVLEVWKDKNSKIEIVILENTDKSSIIGASYMFNDSFWEKIKGTLADF